MALKSVIDGDRQIILEEFDEGLTEYKIDQYSEKGYEEVDTDVHGDIVVFEEE